MASATDAVWIDVLPSMRGFGPALSQGVGRESEAVGKEAGGKFGKAMLAGVAVVAGGAALATKALYNVGSTFFDISTKISGSTGAVGKDLDRMNETVKRVGRDVPRSFEEIGDAVIAVQSNFGGFANMTDAEFDRATTNALNFSKNFEIDMGRVTQVTGQMLKSGLVSDADEAFDLLTAASQKVPVSLREDLLDATDEYGPFFAALGMSGEDAMNALVASSEKGMYGIDKTGDALKEFTIRATDMSTASKVGFDALGMSQEEMSAKLLAGGDTAAGAFDKIVNGLLGIKDPVAQSQAALALFGTPLEDLSTAEIPQFLEGLRSSTNMLGEVEGAATRMGENLNSGPGAAFQLFKNRLIDVVAPAAETLFTSLTAGMEAVANSPFIDWAGRAADIFTGDVLPTLRDLADAVLPRLQSAFDTAGSAIGSVVGFFREHETAAKALAGVVAFVSGVVIGAWVAQAAVATANAARSVLAWFATATASTTSATIQSRSTAQIVVGWIAAAAGAALNAAKVVAAWAVSTAQTGILMAMYASQSVAAAARSTAAWIAAQARTVAALAVTAAGFVAQGAVMAASMAVTAARVVAGWVLMGVQSMVQAARMAAAWFIALGPIGWVIAAVVGLVALIIANWDTVVRWTKQAWDAVMGAISAAWEWIKSATGAAVNWVVGIVTTAWNAVLAAGQWLWNAISGVFTAMWNGVVAIFNGLVNAVQAIWNAYVNTLLAIAQFLWDGIRAVFTALWNGVVAIFNGLVSAVTAIWNAFRDGVIAVAQFLWDGVKRIFELLWRGVVTIFTTVRDTVVAIWTSFRDAVVAGAQFLWDLVTGIFNRARDGWVRIFTGIKDTVIGVWNALRDGVVNGAQAAWDWVTDKFNRMRGAVVSIFEGIRDTVGRVWDGLKAKVEQPIRAVITFVNDKMIGPVNTLLGKFPGNLRIPPIPGFRKGGYTGDGRPDEVKGAVHAGEYVFTQEQVRRLGLPRIEAIANGAVPSSGELDGVRKTTEIGAPWDNIGGKIGSAWDATGGKVVSAVGDAASWVKDIAIKGARKVAEAVLGPLASAAKNLTPNNVIGNMLDGAIDRLMSGVLGKSDEYDKASSDAAASGGMGGGSFAGVPAGDGSLGSNWASLFATLKRLVPQARLNSGVRNTPDAHGRGKAVDFGFGTGPGGLGSAGLALIKRVLHDNFGKNLYELIYNGVGNDRPNLKNSRPLAYNLATQLQHRNHVHAAVYDQGGLWEPGTAGFNFTGGVERVLTPRQDTYFRRFVDSTSSGPSRFEGNLYLDSGEFMGKVQGVATAVVEGHDAIDKRDERRWMSR